VLGRHFWGISWHFGAYLPKIWQFVGIFESNAKSPKWDRSILGNSEKAATNIRGVFEFSGGINAVSVVVVQIISQPRPDFADRHAGFEIKAAAIGASLDLGCEHAGTEAFAGMQPLPDWAKPGACR
jgi:hypothetical protein